MQQLSSSEISRYSRHLSLPEFGRAGQERLRNGSVLLVGVGGLGSPLAMYLAAAGVGRIGLVDFDTVDESNLQRQVIHSTADLGRHKVDSARDRLRAINPHVDVATYPVRLTSENAPEILKDYDVVADGTDNFPTRYLVNDACVLLGKPNVFGSVYRFEGQVTVYGMPGGPCYRCVYPTPPPASLVPSCAEGGVLGVLPGLVGTIQATEVLKILSGIGDVLAGRLLMVDALEMRFRTLELQRDAACPVCGGHPSITRISDYEAFCGVPVQDEMQNTSIPEITVRELKARIDMGQRPYILDVREPDEYQVANLGAPLMPVGELADRISELEPYRDEEIVVHCRSGARSAYAVQVLRNAGFRAINLKGGILAWSNEIDPSVPRY